MSSWKRRLTEHVHATLSWEQGSEKVFSGLCQGKGPRDPTNWQRSRATRHGAFMQRHVAAATFTGPDPWTQELRPSNLPMEGEVCNAIRRGPAVEAFWKPYRIGLEENAEIGPELRKERLIYVVEGSTDGADSDAVERRTLSAPGVCAFCKAPHSNIEVLERKPDLSPMQKNPMGGPHTPW